MIPLESFLTLVIFVYTEFFDNVPLPSDNADLMALLERLNSEMEEDRREHGRRLDRITENLRSLENRVLTIENSRVVRLLHLASGLTCAVKRRAVTRGMPTKLVALLKRSKAWHC